jgi:hypothetical protein
LGVTVTTATFPAKASPVKEVNSVESMTLTSGLPAPVMSAPPPNVPPPLGMGRYDLILDLQVVTEV